MTFSVSKQTTGQDLVVKQHELRKRTNNRNRIINSLRIEQNAFTCISLRYA
jgi:hypothetical protein